MVFLFRKILSIRKGKISRLPMRYSKTTVEHFAPIPLCKDGFLRPYQLSIVVDRTARSPEKVIQFYLKIFGNSSVFYGCINLSQ